MIMSSSETLKTEIVSNTKDELSFKLQQKYKPKLLPGKAVNSLITLTFDDKGKVKYHKVCQSPLQGRKHMLTTVKDMWNEKDYSHEGLGAVMKTLNGDHLTKVTQPPKSL